MARARFWGSEGSFEPSCEVGCDPGYIIVQVQIRICKDVKRKRYLAQKDLNYRIIIRI